MQQRIAQEHRALGVLRVVREVLGHPLDEPQRRRTVRESTVPVHHAAQLFEHERVHHLVAHHVAERTVLPRERHGDPTADQVGEASRGLGQEHREDVLLLEVVVRVVEHQREAPVETQPEALRELLVRLLHQRRDEADEVLVGRVVVDVDVLGLEHLPGVRMVDDLVSAEGVLRPRRERDREKARQGNDDETVRAHAVVIRVRRRRGN